MAKHTPGTWEAFEANVFAGKNCIGICDTDNDTKARMQANARLMAAAPDLLAALEAMMSDYRSEGCPDPSCVVCKCSKAAEQLARAAIAKATGEQS